VKLYARTPAGMGLGINVHLTGQMREEGGKIRSVEVKLPYGCDHVVGYTVEALPKDLAGDQLAWVDPGDLCTNDGRTVNQGELRAEVTRVIDAMALRILLDALRADAEADAVKHREHYAAMRKRLRDVLARHGITVTESLVNELESLAISYNPKPSR